MKLSMKSRFANYSFTHLPPERPFRASLLNAFPLLLMSPFAMAVVVENGEVLDIDASTPSASYAVMGAGSTLNGSSAVTDSISLTGGAALNLDRSSVRSLDDGISVTNSTATVVDTNVTGEFLGLSVNRTIGQTGGSAVAVSGGTIQGGEAGAQVTGLSQLRLNGVSVAGTGAGSAGLNIFGGDVTATAGTTIRGAEHGVYLISDANGVGDNRLYLDNSTVEGVNGAAIQVDVRVNGDIQITNGSVLKGGNGNVLEVRGNSTADVQAIRSTLEGSVQVDQGSTADVMLSGTVMNGDFVVADGGFGSLSLSNQSQLFGDVTGVNNITLGASSMTGDITTADAAGIVLLQNGSVLAGNVSGANDVRLDASSMTGNITTADAAGIVNLGNDAMLDGSVIGSNNVTLDASSMIGDITTASAAGIVSLNHGSVLEGNVAGANEVTLDGSSMTGNITPTDALGVVFLNNGAVLKGNVNGANRISLDRSSMTGDITTADAAGAVSLSNRSLLEGNVTGANEVSLSGSSMTGDIAMADGSGRVLLQQGSALNGNVIGGSTVNLSASQMTGDITSDGAGVVSLQNDSVFTGNLINVDRLTVGDPSVWNLVASNTINSLVMDTGEVRFGAANEFFQLNVGSLSGTGTFVMDADYATNQHDMLNITGSATGSHTLRVAGSGVDPVSPGPLTLVHSAGGNAAFALADGRAVDVGTYSYELTSAGDGMGGTDWLLDPSRPTTVTPGARSVLALFNTAPTVWYGELTSLRSRMGELRFNGGKAGGWVRTYGNKYNVSDASGVGYQQNQQGVSLGADAPLPIGDGQWLVGVLAGYSKSDLNLDRGTSGTVKSTYVGAYTTWMDQDSGYYFDGVLKANRFRNDSKVSMSDGARAKGDYTTQGVGASLEFGRHIKLDDGYFVEPFAQVSGVVISGKDYGLNNGMQAEGDRTRSLLGKVGVTTGRNFALDNGSIVQPYLRVAAAQEFAKNNEVQVNNNVFNNDLSGSRGELGAGVAVAMSDSLQLHADFDYSNGENIEQPFGANVGVRYSW